MKNHSHKRNGYLHLYDPKKEGLGSYDVHYINAYEKDKGIRNLIKNNRNERYVA